MTRSMRALLLAGFLPILLGAQGQGPGIFSTSGDVGEPAIAGATAFDAANGEYRIIGAGANMWGKQDQFQYAWKQVTGDFTIAATLHFLGEGAEHRKAGLVVRQSLEADATYADVIVHGNGMPALQWRSRKGEDTNTFNLPIEGPGTFQIKLVRTGVKIYLYVGRNGAEPTEKVHTEVSFTGPVLVGLGVCSHDAAKAETAIFSAVSLVSPPGR